MYESVESTGKCVESLAKLLGDSFVFSSLAQGYHWNVKGSDFHEYHEFFQEVYEDVHGSIDALAEHILKMGYDAPYFLGDFTNLSDIPGQERIENGDAMAMTASLYETNKVVMASIIRAFDVANSSYKTQSVANFLAERLDAHQKWNWQLGAILNVK